ncbi:cation diffusion facilitator family transporter [Aquamicrobium segne]|uniref:Cation diffusion facilitator family transporter n=1 Tax=Aquamicrobium segne TaxID=469547 RepID=A0ABW0GY40_9HYPH
MAPSHHHGHDHGAHSHGSGDKRRVLIVACLTGSFMIAEALGGLFTNSLALLADAGHMLTDSLALSLAWYAFHLAERPATRRMSYGFARVKTLVAYTNGIAIFIVALWIIYEAWQRFLQPPPILGTPMLVIASLGLVVNIIGFWVLHGGDRDSLNMRGALLHVIGDLLGSAAAIAAALIIILTGWTPIDPILSVLVAVIILSTAWRLMRDAAHFLLEGAPEELDAESIEADLKDTIAGVRDVHHVHLWSLDGTKHIATLHACLKEGTDMQEAVHAIKARLRSKHGVEHATVETEFGPCVDRHCTHAGEEHSHFGHDLAKHAHQH